MNEMKYIKLQDEISAVFRDASILTVDEETLQKYLMSLASEYVPNEGVQHREIIRALTINHIQMQRHIDNLNKKNTTLQILVIVLAIASLIGTAVQILLPDKPQIAVVHGTESKTIEVQPQKQKYISTKVKPNISSEATKGDSSTPLEPPMLLNKKQENINKEISNENSKKSL